MNLNTQGQKHTAKETLIDLVTRETKVLNKVTKWAKLLKTP